MAFRIITRTLLLPNFIERNSYQIPKFSSSICSNTNPLSNIFQRYGFPPSDLHNFFARNRFLLNSSVHNVEMSLKILSSFGSSEHFVVPMVYNCPRVLELDFLKKWEAGISELGFADKTIQNILEVSRQFNLFPDDVLHCIDCLRGFRFVPSTITRVLEELPMIITMNEEKIWSKIEFLSGIGIPRSKLDSIIQTYPGILGFGVESKLKPLISEFTEMGFEPNEIREEIIRNPKILQSEVGELSKCLRMLNSLKCRVPTKEKIFSKGAFRASYEVKLRIDCLHKHGLTYKDAFSILWREPRLILYELEEIDKKIEFLINTMKFDVVWLVEVPEYLGVNLEKQIVPRYSVIEHLRSKGGIGDEVELRCLVKFSRLRFYNLYVKPYPECEMIYGRFANVKVRQGCPEGMWKLFKPRKYPESKEDLKHIKSFMEKLC